MLVLKITMLYFILFLHQTTTLFFCAQYYEKLYFILFLHQTTTKYYINTDKKMLYFILFLHQTTTFDGAIHT